MNETPSNRRNSWWIRSGQWWKRYVFVIAAAPLIALFFVSFDQDSFTLAMVSLWAGMLFFFVAPRCRKCGKSVTWLMANDREQPELVFKDTLQKCPNCGDDGSFGKSAGGA